MNLEPIPNQRHLFDLPADAAYLNCAYVAPLPRAGREAGEVALDRRGRPWEIRAPDFFAPCEELRALFARLIGAGADDVAITPAASYGLAVAAANLPLAPGQRVLLLAEQFPSNVYAWHAKAVAAGAEIVTVARPADDDWTAAVLEQLDERVAIVAVPNCHWTDGGLLDLVAVGQAARAAGAALVVDVTQSLGALPFDVAAVQPDFLAVASYKWLLGPYGLGMLYVAPRHQQGRPLEEGWASRRGAEDFASLVDYRDDYAPGARRFDQGGRAQFHLLPIATAALRLIEGWGVAAIQATLAARTRAIAERAAALGMGSAPAGRRGGHFLGLRFPGALPAGLPERLAAANVYVSVRGSALRVAPHLYTTDADVDRLFAVLEKAARS